MKLTQRTRLMLGCLADVRRSRQLVATAWRGLRSMRVDGGRPISAAANDLWKAQAWLAMRLRTLELAWECCVRPG